jgi:phytoene synthase
VNWVPGLALEDPRLREFLPAAGSALHYALLYQPAESRDRLRVVEALRQNICSLPLTSSNAEVAHARLGWWYENLSTSGDTTSGPGHPLLRALQPGFAADPTLRPAFVSLIEGIARLQAAGRFANIAERTAAWHSTHAPIWHVHARLCGFADARIANIISQLGTAIALAETLVDLRRAVRGEIAFVCRDREPDSTDAGLQTSDAQWYAALARRELPELTAMIHRGVAELPAPRGERRRLRALRVMAALTLDTLTELGREQGRVWEMRVELTPLRRLWRAWCVRVEA